MTIPSDRHIQDILLFFIVKATESFKFDETAEHNLNIKCHCVNLSKKYPYLYELVKQNLNLRELMSKKKYLNYCVK